jgi:hypothetical protein
MCKSPPTHQAAQRLAAIPDFCGFWLGMGCGGAAKPGFDQSRSGIGSGIGAKRRKRISNGGQILFDEEAAAAKRPTRGNRNWAAEGKNLEAAAILSRNRSKRIGAVDPARDQGPGFDE